MIEMNSVADPDIGMSGQSQIRYSALADSEMAAILKFWHIIYNKVYYIESLKEW
jgi:hypothetical protein